MIMRVANIIEEGRLGGPQIRIMNVAKALKGKVETTIIMPQMNSDKFRSYCDDQGLLYKALPLKQISKSLKAVLVYIITFPFDIFQI